MKIIGLDLSTSTGLCVFVDDKLRDYIKIERKVVGTYKSATYPINYTEMAEDLALKIASCVLSENPDVVVIEETNKGRNRFSQKQLEFIHFAVSKALNKLNNPPKIEYIDSSAWRSILGISLDKDQRLSNKNRQKARDEHKQKLKENFLSEYSRKIEIECLGLGKRDTNKIVKTWSKKIDEMVSKEMRKFRTESSKIDTKNLSVDHVNKEFNLKFKKNMNDVADSICLVHAFIKNNYSTKVIKRV